MFGFLNVYKPMGMTSHDVVAVLRKKIKIKQIGHSGTLDPLATGVLPIAIGKATRLIEYLSDEKAYIASLEFGKISDTYDIEGKVESFSTSKVTREQIETSLTDFLGKIEQIPPAYSAVHYNGKRLYELAREGIIPDDIPKREVFVEEIKLIDFDDESQMASLYIKCSKGTYIRTIIHDLGQKLVAGAVMTGLERVLSSNFIKENSVSLDDIESPEDVKKWLINPVDVLSYNQKLLTDDELEKVKHGNSLLNNGDYNDGILLLKHINTLVAIGLVEGNIIKISKVLV